MEGSDLKLQNNSYDNFSTQYKESKELPFRRVIEEYTIMKICGSLKGLKVLDLACGEGIYSRKLKNRGAAEVFGVDLSSEMIKLAEANEKENPLGIKYMVGDAASLEKIGDFDIVVGCYLLNFAETKEELYQFCESVYKNLKKGGRFIGFNDNPFYKAGPPNEFKKYGFNKEIPKEEDKKEGYPIKFTMYNKDGSQCSFNNFFWSPQTYEETLKAVGFYEIHWEGPFLDDSLTPELKAEFNGYMENPPSIGFSTLR